MSRVAQYFGKLSSVYGDGDYYRARRNAVLASIALDLARAHRLLDLGCGNGAYTLEFCSMSSITTVVAADLSAEMIEVARERLARKHQVAMLRVDASALPFLPEKFDLVFMSNLLPFVIDADRCLNDVVRSLAPRGTLVATIGGGVEGALARGLGQQRWREFQEKVFWPVTSAAFVGGNEATTVPAAPQGGYLQACENRGVRAELRTVSYSCKWAAIDELIRIRWLTIANDDQRATGERLLSQAGGSKDVASMRFEFAENLLVGRKAP